MQSCARMQRRELVGSSAELARFRNNPAPELISMPANHHRRATLRSQPSKPVIPVQNDPAVTVLEHLEGMPYIHPLHSGAVPIE